MVTRVVDPGDCDCLYEQVADILRTQILAGEIPPRRAIPSRHVLMGKHGVSARTARDAVQLLAREGLIEWRQGKGYFVIPPEKRGRPA